MAYRVGYEEMPRGRDFEGRHVRLLRDVTTMGGSVFAKGETMSIKSVWKGHVSLRSIDGADRVVVGVSGFDVEFVPDPPASAAPPTTKETT